MQRKVLRWHPACSLVFKRQPFGVSSEGFGKTYPCFFQRGNCFHARYTGKIIEKFIQRPAMPDAIGEGFKRYPGPAKNGLAAQYSRVADDNARCHVFVIPSFPASLAHSLKNGATTKPSTDRASIRFLVFGSAPQYGKIVGL